jgi:hypothetical protein
MSQTEALPMESHIKASHHEYPVIPEKTLEEIEEKDPEFYLEEDEEE